jgi:hypothetical protein
LDKGLISGKRKEGRRERGREMNLEAQYLGHLMEDGRTGIGEFNCSRSNERSFDLLSSQVN